MRKFVLVDTETTLNTNTAKIQIFIYSTCIEVMRLFYRGENFDANFYYHAGVDIDNSFLLISETKKKTLLVPKLNERFARAKFRGQVLHFVNPFDILQKYIKGKTVFVDFCSLNAIMVKKLQKICKLVDTSEELMEGRAIKNISEIDKIKQAVIHTREMFASLDFKSAKTEQDVAKQLLIKTIEMGLESAFEPIVSTDKNTAYPHSKPTNKKLGSFVLVDYGVKYQHYCSDMTRCFVLDGDRKKNQEYEKLKNVQQCICDEMPELKFGKEVTDLAHKLMKKAGFPDMIHSIGHGIGLEVHEFPRFGKKSVDIIKKTTMAIEPAFYTSKYGMRYENVIYFDGKKARIL